VRGDAAHPIVVAGSPEVEPLPVRSAPDAELAMKMPFVGRG
jgi:hypothetical protein